MLMAVAMVKDEADIIGHTMQHLVDQGVDGFVIANNLSTDDTSRIVAGFDNVVLTYDTEFGYYQSLKMTDLCDMARDLGATWILPFDADEQILGPQPETLRVFFAACPDDVGIVSIEGWDLVPRPDDDPDEPNPYRRLRYRRPVPQRLPKIAFRATPGAKVHMGNHDVSGVPGRRIGGLRLRHAQYRSLEQMTRKLRNGAAVYAATDLHENHGTHWREGAQLTDADLAARWDAMLTEPAVLSLGAPPRG